MSSASASSAELERYFALLRQIATGIALMSEISDRTRARVMATGELMATELGARFLECAGHRGLLVGRALRAEGRSTRPSRIGARQLPVGDL